MKRILLCLLMMSFFLGISDVLAQTKNNQIVVSGRKNDIEQQKKPYVILISADGYRHDYIEQYYAKFLKKISENGVRAKALIPSFPSLTFPNHYTIVTGLYPSHHGLVGNNIYDPKIKERYSLGNRKAVLNPIWYGGTPIWTLAEQDNLLTACYYWPGSEAAIQGILPTYHYPYSEKTPIDDRIEEVINWLNLPEEKRPHFITFYMPDVDKAGHKYGPNSTETQKAVEYTDIVLEKLTSAVAKINLPVNYIFLSDHGMTDINIEEPLSLPIKIDPEEIVVVSSGSHLSLFVKDSSKIKSIQEEIISHKDQRYKTYLKNEIPEHSHFNEKDDYFGRIGDIIVIAKEPYYFSNRKPNPGAHGFDPYEYSDMKTTFICWGPQIKENLIIEEFENIHIYPLIAKLLGLEINHTIDGDNRLIDKVLK